MMETYVLTVIKDNLLDNCEVFASQQDALDSARRFCEINNINYDPKLIYDFFVKGWLVSDSYGYFITVVQRVMRNEIFIMGSSYAALLDTLSGRGTYSARNQKLTPLYSYNNSGFLDGYVSVFAPKPVPIPPLPVSPPPSLPPPSKDDAQNGYLPGGFLVSNFTSGDYCKPLTMWQVRNDPYNVIDTGLLSENEKWALVLARTKHRPHQVILIKGLGCWSQHHMLEELTKQTDLGKKMRAQELEEIQAMYEMARLEHNRDEESSSSSEEESSEY